jgi:excisionase family DNA binding protein
MGEVLNVNDIARLLKVSTQTVRREIDDGKLEAFRVGKKSLRVSSEAFEKYVAAHGA